MNEIFNYLVENLISIETFVSVLALWSKINLFRQKDSGFIVGAVTSFIGIIYAYNLGLYVYMIAEISGFIHMTFGYINHQSEGVKFKKILKIVTISAMVVILAVNKDSSIVELFGAILGIIAFEHFAIKRPMKAWIYMIFAHMIYNYFMYLGEQWIMFTFQILSILVAGVAIKELIKKSEKNQWPLYQLCRYRGLFLFVFCCLKGYTYSVEEFLHLLYENAWIPRTILIFSKGG